MTDKLPLKTSPGLPDPGQPQIRKSPVSRQVFDPYRRSQDSVAILNDISEPESLFRDEDLNRNQLRQILDTTSGAIRLVDTRFDTVLVNDSFTKLCGIKREEIIGRKCYDIFTGPQCHTKDCPIVRLTGSRYKKLEYEIVKKKDEQTTITCRLTAAPYRNTEGRIVGIVEDFVDISDHRQIEEELKAANLTLWAERKVLNQKNVALREMLDQLEREKQRLAHQMQSNIDSTVMPLVRNIRAGARQQDRGRLDLLERTLADVVSPFVSTLKRQYNSLTPREIEICNMIQKEMSSKEIAGALNTTEGTVEQQRKSIRRKLGITCRKTNLTSYLKTL